VLLTSHGAQEDVLEGMRAGADEYVTKPLDPFVLHTRLLAARRVTALHGALADALAEAEDSNERLAEFTGRVSHDLRNPLTSILGYVELGATDAESGQPEEAAEYLEIVGGSARRMPSMVEELLAFASIGGSLSRFRLSLATLVKEVTDDLSPGLRESGAVVQCQDFEFDAEPSQMRVALQNLIQNAVAYRRPEVPRSSGSAGRAQEMAWCCGWRTTARESVRGTGAGSWNRWSACSVRAILPGRGWAWPRVPGSLPPMEDGWKSLPASAAEQPSASTSAHRNAGISPLDAR
jgi:signal transduction histidine kinase